ncbi:hypothetical protein SAMN04515647_3537 [Cohaesibacter sp. ES.047]|uniref:hypothetical protein n=1 Tax=Cohaesibacter sp. ES.047 TaxID=1798205 RepID=UPI000BB8BF3C|nr:hypothetical protein [Cohaesibacter sp. ES.047]SNY93250.1 hypothetical protein SAMN04515647_3537 [Cohaesibacter sp. ES.047]
MIAILAPVFLAGCITSDVEPLQQQSLARPAQTDAPVTKQQKLLEEGKPVNDYVNTATPSQMRYSVHLLTEPESTADFPPIRDITTNRQELHSEQERLRLEQELRNLAKKNAN